MFSVNLLNNPGKQTGKINDNIIESKLDNDIKSNDLKENLQKEQKSSNRIFKTLALFLICFFIFLYYYLIIYD